MEYKIIIAKTFYDDLDDALEYISQRLFNPPLVVQKDDWRLFRYSWIICSPCSLAYSTV